MHRNAPSPVLFLIVGLIAAVFLLFGLWVLYLVYAAMAGIPEKHRPMNPGKVWLLVIPIFNLYWNFQVYPPMLDAYIAALRERDIPVGGDGKGAALTYCISSCLCVVPFLNIFAGLAGLVTFIMTLVKAYEFKRQLA